MTKQTQLAVAPRDRFLEAARKELIAFERREREFRKLDQQQRVGHEAVLLYAFDLIEHDGDDLRRCVPLIERKRRLAQSAGIVN